MWILSTLFLIMVSTTNGSAPAILSPCEKDIIKMVQGKYTSLNVSLRMISYCGDNIFLEEDTTRLVSDAGNYIACQAMKEATHCLVVRNPMQIRGICVPNSCNEENLAEAMIQVGGIFQLPKIFNVTEEMMHCGDHQHNLGSGGTVILLVCVLLIILVIAATSFDMLNAKRTQRLSTRHGLTQPLNEDQSRGTLQSQNKTLLEEQKSPTDFSEEDEDLSFLERCLVAFSVRRNWATLMHRPPARKYKALDGIRSISLIGVIIAHSANFTLMVGFTNPMDIYPPHGSAGKYDFILFIMVWGFAVDSFFFLSGFLSTLVIVRKLDKGMNPLLAPILGTLHRFLRLTPTFGFVVAVFSTMGNSLGSGPFWWQMELLTKKCRKNWWTGILYISNFWPTVYDEQCLPWTWYLANDFQFAVFGIVFMCVIHKCRRWAELVLSLIACISIGVTMWITSHWDVAALSLVDGGKMQNYVYNKPYCRIPAYIIGMISVLIFMRIEKRAKERGQRSRNIRRAMRFRQWWVAPLLMVISIGVLLLIASFLWWDATLPKVDSFTKTQNILYLGFTRPCWALAIGVMVLLCLTGQGGIVNKVLSWWFWIPIAQLTYSAYLIHPIIIRIVFFNRPQLFTYTDSILVMNGCAFVVLAYTAAVVIFCTIEMPFGTLEGLIIGGGKKRKRQVSTIRPKAEG